MNSTTEYKNLRASAYNAIAAEILRGLPAPTNVMFSDDAQYADDLSIQLADAEDFDAWAKLLNANVWQRDERFGDTIQSHASSTPWRGFSVSLSVCQRVGTKSAVFDEPPVNLVDRESAFAGPSPELVAEVKREDRRCMVCGEPEPCHFHPDSLPTRTNVTIAAHHQRVDGATITVGAVAWGINTITLDREAVPAEVWAMPNGATLTALLSRNQYGEPVFSEWEWETRPAVVPAVPAAISDEPVVTKYRDDEGDHWRVNADGTLTILPFPLREPTLVNQTIASVIDRFGPLTATEWGPR